MEAFDEASPMVQDYPCPGCGAGVLGDGVDVVMQCPACGQQFFRPVKDEEAGVEVSSNGDPVLPKEDELSGLHIRQITVQRRAAFRARSYCIIGAAACLVIAIQIAYMMRNFSHAQAPKSYEMGRPMIAGDVVLMVGLLWGFVHLTLRAIALTHELRRSLLEEPVEPPDFSTLSDGSQYARNLEDIGSQQ